MGTDCAFRRGLAVFLIVASALIGAAMLDELYYNRQDRDFKSAIETRFIEQSSRVGAWAMDREYVSRHIGIEESELPSYKRSVENE
jgi:hypothetical protein